jgi:hypothetical protein
LSSQQYRILDFRGEIGPGTANERIVARLTVDQVVAGTTVKPIGDCAADQLSSPAETITFSTLISGVALGMATKAGAGAEIHDDVGWRRRNSRRYRHHRHHRWHRR